MADDWVQVYERPSRIKRASAICRKPEIYRNSTSSRMLLTFGMIHIKDSDKNLLGLLSIFGISIN